MNRIKFFNPVTGETISVVSSNPALLERNHIAEGFIPWRKAPRAVRVAFTKARRKGTHGT